MTIRVLHIFAPNFKNRFGGPFFDWQYAFSRWDDQSVVHFVLDHQENKIVNAREAFTFRLSSSQFMISRVNRAVWGFSLIYNLFRFRANYDVVHFHILWWGSLLAATWAKWHRIPTIYQSVLLDADTPGKISKERFGGLKVNLLKNFTCILAISDFLAQDYLNNDFGQDQVITLMNSVDTQLFSPCENQEEKLELRQKLGLPINSTILIFVGSIIHRKGIDVLIEAYKLLSQEKPDLVLLLVGPQTIQENPSLDEKWIGSLKNTLAKENLASNVMFLGLVSDRQYLADLYRVSDLFVFPSRMEGLGNVVLEAMASGLPVVSSDLPVLKNVILPGENGLVFPVEDIIALTDNLRLLLDNAILCDQIGKNARLFVNQQHSFAEWQSKITTLYRDLLA